MSGCASNMSTFYSYFSSIVLLTAPEAVIVERLRSRRGNAYGSTVEEMERVLRLRQSIEPLLRRVADLEIDTGIAGRSVAEAVLNFVLH